MNRLEARVLKPEGRGRGGWRAYAGVPLAQWPGEALHGFLAESGGWPPDHAPTDEELGATAPFATWTDEDGGTA